MHHDMLHVGLVILADVVFILQDPVEIIGGFYELDPLLRAVINHGAEAFDRISFPELKVRRRKSFDAMKPKEVGAELVTENAENFFCCNVLTFDSTEYAPVRPLVVLVKFLKVLFLRVVKVLSSV